MTTSAFDMVHFGKSFLPFFTNPEVVTEMCNGNGFSLVPYDVTPRLTVRVTRWPKMDERFGAAWERKLHFWLRKRAELGETTVKLLEVDLLDKIVQGVG